MVFPERELSDILMQAIAREMNQSETAFITKSETCDLKARYFTPDREIPLAGHPTIASIHAALNLAQIPQKDSYQLELRDGAIRVDRIQHEGESLIRMHQRAPKFLSRHDSARMAEIFSLDENDFLPDLPIETVSTGTPMLMIPLVSKEALKRVVMKTNLYKTYRDNSDFFSPHFFVLEGATEKGQTFARHLGLPPDTQEDSFTGSATGCMGAYIWHHGLFQTDSFYAEQGHWMQRPGIALVERKNNIVSVAGSAITVVNGTLSL